MPSTYTNGLRLTKQGIGENDSTWGTIANTQYDLIDEAVRGLATVAITTGSTVTLSTNNGADDDSRKAILKLNGTPTANINVIVPSVSKIYTVDGSSFLGAFSVTIKTLAGTGITFTAGQNGLIICDGTNVKEIYKSTSPIPSGFIGFWSGTIATVPTGWFLCDGSNGTPDLRDKFIIGASADNLSLAKTNITGSLTQTGGSKDAVVVLHDHVAVVNETPHEHEISNVRAIIPRVGGGATNVYDNGAGTLTTEPASTGLTVTINSSGVSGTNQNLPPYYALAMIMKA